MTLAHRQSDTEETCRSVVQDLVMGLCRAEWKGWDPFDGLSSPTALLLKGNRLRQAWVQLHKRSPLNLRRVFGVKPKLMVKTAALAILAAARSSHVRSCLEDQLPYLESVLKKRARGDNGLAWWGYEFPVQTRWAYYPEGSPNAVVTSFAADALMAWPEEQHDALLSRVASHITGSVASSPQGKFFRYVRESPELVHNASALAASTLARVGKILERPEWVELALEVGQTLIRYQSSDGSWPYGEKPYLSWRDGFHTAYVLLSLQELVKLGFYDGEAALRNGVKFFWNAFVDPERGSVRYYAHGRAYPEAHNFGTCLQALIELPNSEGNSSEVVDAVIQWGLKSLWLPKRRRFAYRSGRLFRNQIAYPRWSDGHVLLGLASYLGEAERARP